MNFFAPWRLKFVLVYYLVADVMAMYSKRALPSELHHVPDEKRLKYNAADLFLSNHISADRAVSLFRDAGKSNPEHVRKLGAGKGHAHRNLLRKLLKETRGWPSLYYAKIRLWDTEKEEPVIKLMPFFLPHELLSAVVENSDLSLMRHVPVPHLDAAAAELGVNKECLVALGLWGDGTPCNFDSESLESFCLNFPGVHHMHCNLRWPLTRVNRKYVAKHDTFDDIMEIIT